MSQRLMDAARSGNHPECDVADYVLKWTAWERLQLLQQVPNETWRRAGSIEAMLGMEQNPCKWTCLGCGEYYRPEIAEYGIFYLQEVRPVCRKCRDRRMTITDLNIMADVWNFRLTNYKCSLCPCHPDEIANAVIWDVTADGIQIALCRNCALSWVKGMEYWELDLNVRRTRGRYKPDFRNDVDFVCPVCSSTKNPRGYLGWEVGQRVCKKCHNKLHRDVFEIMPGITFVQSVGWLKAIKAEINLCNVCGTGMSCKPRCRMFGNITLCLAHAIAEMHEVE